MTRDEAGRLIEGVEEVNFLKLDDVFKAYGFRASSPSNDTEVYSHPLFPKCGRFTARDDGIHVLTPQQKGLVLAMLRCVVISESLKKSSGDSDAK